QFTAIIEGYGAALLVSLVAYRSDLIGFKVLDAWPVRRLGLASGSYYVLHGMTISTGLAVAEFLLPPAWSTAAPAAVGYLVTSFWLAALGLLSLFAYYAVEAPGIALGRRLIKSRALGPAAPRAS